MNPELFLHDLRTALRSLARAKGLTITVALTLALGIGANAAIFSVVRGVLLRPLVNRDEDRLIYIRQSARGIGADNVTFSVPEIQDLRERVKTLSAFGDFSTIGFTMVGLGEPPEGRRRGGADLSFLDDGTQQRSVRDRQNRQARRSRGHRRGRAGAVRAVSGGNRDHRKRRDKPASSVGDDGDRSGPSDDGTVRPAGARSRSR